MLKYAKHENIKNMMHTFYFIFSFFIPDLEKIFKLQLHFDYSMMINKSNQCGGNTVYELNMDQGYSKM